MSERYIEDTLKKYLGGKTPTEAGLSKADLKKLLECYESGGAIEEIHLTSVPTLCACNICRS